MTDLLPARTCHVCRGGLRSARPLTYVVRRERWVKIGSTGDLERRLRQLARGSCLTPQAMNIDAPLTLLRVINRPVEHELHQLFDDHHAHGEWFHLNASVSFELAAGVLAPGPLRLEGPPA